MAFRPPFLKHSVKFERSSNESRENGPPVKKRRLDADEEEHDDIHVSKVLQPARLSLASQSFRAPVKKPIQVNVTEPTEKPSSHEMEAYYNVLW